MQKHLYHFFINPNEAKPGFDAMGLRFKISSVSCSTYAGRIIENRSANFYWATVLVHSLALNASIFVIEFLASRACMLCKGRGKKKNAVFPGFDCAQKLFTFSKSSTLLRGSITFRYRSFVNKGSTRASESSFV